ncbi:putative reverse transcriptase domain-containing protein [Tanacetum coccineum]
MAPKRATRSTRATTTPAPTATTTTTVTNAQLQAMIDQGVSAALAARDATRNGTDSHSSGTGVRGSERVARETNIESVCRKVLPDMIHGNIVASKPKTMQEAIEMATELMDKRSESTTTKEIKSKTPAEQTLLIGEKKTKWADHRPHAQSANTTRRSVCLKCSKMSTNMVTSPVTVRVQEMPTTLTTRRAPDQVRNLLVLSAELREHYKRSVQMKNNKGNRGNQAGNDRAPAKVYVVGNAGANPDNVVAGTFLLNNRYAYILFDTGADRSFVSTTFSSQIDITPSTLDHYYDVELADGRIIGLNTILKGCTLNFLNHQFNINLMPVELGSFDAIIGMDWLAKYQAVIVCAEKIVRIPWKNKTLIIHGDGSTQGNVTRLNIISCTKTQKYMEKGFPIFLAHVTTKEIEDKSEKKRLEDVPIVQEERRIILDVH